RRRISGAGRGALHRRAATSQCRAGEGHVRDRARPRSLGSRDRRKSQGVGQGSDRADESFGQVSTAKYPQLMNAPGCETGPGAQLVTWGKSTVCTVDAFGYKWQWTTNSSKHIPFDWTGP